MVAVGTIGVGRTRNLLASALRASAASVLLASAASAACVLACSDGSGGDAGSGGAAAAAGLDAGSGAGVGTSGASAAAGVAGPSSSSAGSTAGSSAPTAGTAGASPPRSKRGACIAYTEAVCRRLLECGLNAVDCSADYRDLCPDWTFAEGSERTVEQMFECAEIWSNYPCAELRTGARPCRLPGTFAPGEPCIAPAQCDSQVCGSALKGASASCATCARLAEPGDACGTDGIACPYPEPVGLTDPAPLGMGAECDYAAQCTEGLDCRVADDVARCLPLGELGDGCETYLGCREGLGCVIAAGDRLRCTILPAPGEPCARTALDRPPSYCAPGARCADGMCQALPSSGEPCWMQGQPARYCALESSCLFAALDDVGECVPRAALGERCRCRTFTETDGSSVECPSQAEIQADPDCGEGLRCRCESCDLAACKAERLEGESCAEPHTFCEEHTECKDGVCVGLESLGLFEQECMP